jgi:LTXXQ motif family protein
MRKIGTIFAITAFVAVNLCPTPVAAFGVHLGPFYFHVPFVGRHHRPRFQMRADEARIKPNGVSRGAAKPVQTDQEARFETDTQVLGSCAGLVPEPANLPIERIRQTVHPAPDQEAALDHLRATSSRASGIIKSVCSSSVPLTPIGRLDAAEQRVDATIKALEIVRGGLANFYDSLSDEQKRLFNAMDSSNERAWPAGDIVTMCSQQAESFDLPVSRIEQVVQPAANQRSAFDELKKATQSATEQLQSSCPSAVPLSPMARVDTATTGLRAVADAIKSIRPALENFYASLNDEQKARFNMMGGPLPQRG